ncbi:MAG: alkaline phosphatase family protein [Angelakisella sp.]
MGKTIFVLLDACRFDMAKEYGGYLEHMIDAGLGAKYRVNGELPSMSRPMYETLMTGLTASVHGVTGNKEVRPSRCENLFSLCRKHGLCTAAAAYHWYSDLYGKSPFDWKNDRYQLDSRSDIMHGIYYFEDQYPDSHLYLDGEFLRKTYSPDFLLLHPMNIDYWGHKAGGDSGEYRQAVQTSTELLASFIPTWLAEGYQVVISADHGMDNFGIHAGDMKTQREVPLYLFGTPYKAGSFCDYTISQLNIAPLLCKLLEIPATGGMLSKLEIE